MHPGTAELAASSALVGASVLALALGFRLAPLAEGTSVVTLLVFAIVNLALWRIKGRADEAEVAFRIPRWVPGLGAIATTGLLVLRLNEALAG